MTTRRLFLSVPMLAFAAVVAPSGAIALNPTTGALEFPLEYDSVPAVYATRSAESLGLTRSLSANWQVQTSSKTGLVHAAYGGNLSLASAVTTEAQAATLTRSFLLTQSDLLGVRSDNMQLRNVRHARGKYAVHYDQVISGIPVHRADAWVLMDEAGTVAAFGSDFFPEYGEILAHSRLTSTDAVDAAANALGATPTAGAPVDVRTVYVPAPSGELMELTVAYEVTFETAEPFGNWRTIVHGLTGEILARDNLYETINVTGTADGNPNNNPPTFHYCDGTKLESIADMTVTVQGGNSAVTDAAGNFDIAHGGSSPVNVDAALLGPFVDVNRFSGLGADAGLTTSITPGTPGSFTWSTTNARQDEIDTFFHGNTVRDFMFSLDNTMTQLDAPTTSTVGRTDGFCPGNAWWSIGAFSMNFCEENVGAGNANTGEMANVIYHEYGHGITEAVYPIRNGATYPVGDMSEGNSDVVANYIDRNSVIGLGFFLGSCGSGIRDANNSLQWPADNDGGHSGGQIIAGFHWDSWQSLLGTETQAVADSIAFNTWHYGRDMGTPQDQPSQVLWTFMLDDDDADLTNGTPNYDHFCLAATNHGFSCPTILTGVIITHTELGHTTNDVTGYDVVATITSTAAGLDASELKVIYQLDGGPDNTLLMTATGNPDEYSAQIPVQDQHTEVTYYLSAMDLSGNSRTDPPLAPTDVHAFDVAMVYDDMEGGTTGWSTVDAAATGQWEVADPISTTAVPDDDATPGAGVNAWITGQCSGPNCSGGCTLGCNDIDAGTVELLTPVYDVSGFDQVKVKYDRFYNNNTGADPNNDTWTVEISNDGGSTWSSVETTTGSTTAWTTVSYDVDANFGTPNQVQLRFIASDLGLGSVVEAGVDEVRVLASATAATAVTPLLPAEPAVLSLEQNQPNPFRPETNIRFTLPARSSVRLNVYDVQGRTVRTLVSGRREAGSHAVTWNGRDDAGSKVAAGVYFYRLTAGSDVLTRKMTVLK